MNFSLMSKILDVNVEDMSAVTKPGVARYALNQHILTTGLFPVDPGANASLGGVAATGASGTTTAKYDNMRSNVLSLGVALADGCFIETGNLAPKSSAGYDLTSLLVGSEGTLGLITKLTLRLYPKPDAISAGIIAFEDVESAFVAVKRTNQLCIPMSRIEFVETAITKVLNN